MKHSSTGLKLHTETVRHLSGEQLSRAGGGGTITQVEPPTTGVTQVEPPTGGTGGTGGTAG
jgi:hypothetical protein